MTKTINIIISNFHILFYYTLLRIFSHYVRLLCFILILYFPFYFSLCWIPWLHKVPCAQYIFISRMQHVVYNGLGMRYDCVGVEPTPNPFPFYFPVNYTTFLPTYLLYYYSPGCYHLPHFPQDNLSNIPSHPFILLYHIHLLYQYSVRLAAFSFIKNLEKK